MSERPTETAHEMNTSDDYHLRVDVRDDGTTHEIFDIDESKIARIRRIESGVRKKSEVLVEEVS